MVKVIQQGAYECVDTWYFDCEILCRECKAVFQLETHHDVAMMFSRREILCYCPCCKVANVIRRPKNG